MKSLKNLPINDMGLYVIHRIKGDGNYYSINVFMGILNNFLIQSLQNLSGDDDATFRTIMYLVTYKTIFFFLNK